MHWYLESHDRRSRHLSHPNHLGVCKVNTVDICIFPPKYSSIFKVLILFGPSPMQMQVLPQGARTWFKESGEKYYGYLRSTTTVYLFFYLYHKHLIYCFWLLIYISILIPINAFEIAFFVSVCMFTISANLFVRGGKVWWEEETKFSVDSVITEELVPSFWVSFLRTMRTSSVLLAPPIRAVRTFQQKRYLPFLAFGLP